MQTPTQWIEALEGPARDGEVVVLQAARAFLDGDVPLAVSLPTELAEALVEVLVRRSDAARLERLAASKDKSVVKPARRGIHLLRTRGVKAEVPLAARAVERPAAAPEPEPPSVMSAVLRDGEFLVWYVQPRAEGVAVHQAQITETEGLVKFESYGCTRKQWRAISRSIGVEAELPVAQLPSELARWLLEEGYRRALELGRTPPRDYAEARHTLAVPIAPKQHPVEGRVPEEAIAIAGPPEKVLELPETATWIPDETTARQAIREIHAIGESSLIVENRTRLEQVEDVLRRTRVEALKASWGKRLERRLRDTAWFILCEGDDGRRDRDWVGDAALCLAAARHMADESVSAEENRVARALFARLTPVPRPAEAPEEPAGGGLIITP